jgi:Uma2 family endonuclease
MSEPAWDIAKLFPAQGTWTEDEYLELAAKHRRVEFDDGIIEVLPVPTRTHQNILKRLLLRFDAYAQATGGRVSFAGTRLKLPGNKYREPDLLVATAPNVGYEAEEHWTGADLVAEVVSPSAEDHDRDYVRKRDEYGRGGVAEYWIVDPELMQVVVLVLRDGRYVEHCTYGRGEVARPATLVGVEVDVDALFAG